MRKPAKNDEKKKADESAEKINGGESSTVHGEETPQSSLDTSLGSVE